MTLEVECDASAHDGSVADSSCDDGDACGVTVVVLGDSTAAGFGDPVEHGKFRGFGPLLTRAMGEPERIRLVNVGRSGARVRCVRRDQVPVAIEARPQVAMLVVGLNDTLRADFRSDDIYTDLSEVVTVLTACGAMVLTVRYHDHGRVLPLPGRLARALTARIDELNAVIDRVVREHDVHCLDLAALPACYEFSTWSIDRLHPSERGHRLLARGFAELLLAAGHAVPGLESINESDGVVPTRSQQLHWLVTRGIPWFCRRSRDLVALMLWAAVRPAADERRIRSTAAAGQVCRTPRAD